MTQVQIQMYVYKTESCHFVVWTPKFCFSVDIKRNENYSDEINRLALFHNKHILKELVTRGIENIKNALEVSENIYIKCFIYIATAKNHLMKMMT